MTVETARTAARGWRDGSIKWATLACLAGCIPAAIAAPDNPPLAEEIHSLTTKATATAGVIRFNPAPVGVAAASAQKLTATFKVSGYSGSFTPTAKLHYGLSYEAGPVVCSLSEGGETCTVPIAFRPAYPGPRRDALFLMDGSVRLATVLLFGVGEGPLALVQPGSVLTQLNSTGNGNNNYFYRSVTDENGTVWSIGVDSLTSVNREGVITEITVAGLQQPRAIAIDGAGVLYFALSSSNSALVTYDTVRGTAGTYPLPGPEYFTTVGTGDAGNIYVVDTGKNVLYTFEPNGSSTKLSLQYTPLSIAADGEENLFFGSYGAIDELTAQGVQKQLNPNAGQSGIAVDAAETLYVPFYLYGTAELLATNYAAPGYNFNADEFPDGVSVGADGTVSIGADYSLLQYTRSKGELSFSGNVGKTTAAQAAGIYNGGNSALTIEKIALAGAAFAMAPVATGACKVGLVLAPGESCQADATYTAPHAGSFSGLLAFTTNSLNHDGAVTYISLEGTTEGVYVTAAPATLVFPYQAAGTTSGARAVTLTNMGYQQEAFIGQANSSNSAFAIKAGGCETPLQIGQSCKLSVTFSPSAKELYSGTITVPTDLDGGGTGPQVEFNVEGSALPPLALAVKEIVNVSDGVPVTKPSTVLAIGETIRVSDGTPETTPSTILAIGEKVHVTDAATAKE